MSSVTQRRRPAKKKKAEGWLPRFWPLLAGIAVTPFAVWGASVLAMSGPAALRLLYPYVILVQGHADHFPTSQQETMAQLVMYVQFPLYGAIWFFARRWFKGSAGLMSVVLLHCGGIAAVILGANA